MIKYIYWLIFRKKVREEFLPRYRNAPPPPPPLGRVSFEERLKQKMKEQQLNK